MKFWQSLAFTETDQLIETAKIVEEVGFEGAFVSDHLFLPGSFEKRYPYSQDGDPGFLAETPWPQPWPTIAAMAAVTSKLRFSTLIYILPLHDPIEVAKATGTLAVLSNNRFALGAGAGWMHEEFDIMGVDFKARGRLFNESMEVCRKLWTGEMVEHHGNAYDFPPLQMAPAPTEPVPIYIGGISDVALRRAGTLGDGWLGSGQTTEEALEMLAKIREHRRAAGRENEPFEAVVPLVTEPDPDAFKRLEDAGATATVSYPFTYTVGPTSDLDAKRAYLEGFANNVIVPLS
ncbi:MAG: TIGR03619 family F420-dependent LLM class oxidoreductase [Myxococcota bacterium]